MAKNCRKCVICNRREFKYDDSLFFTTFPLDESRCKEWIQLVGNPDLVFVPIEKLNKIRFICGDHFIKKHFNKKGNRLKKTAIPQLKLTLPRLTDEQLIEFPCHVQSYKNAAIASTTQTLATPGNIQLENDAVMHVFPNPTKFPERFKTWVGLVKHMHNDLSEYEFYKKKRICDIHFADDHRNRFKRLNAIAVPTLHLSTTPGASNSETNSSQPNVCDPASVDTGAESQPTIRKLQKIDHNYCKTGPSALNVAEHTDERSQNKKVDSQTADEDNDAPPSPLQENNIPSEETAPVPVEEEVFSWQRTELLTADDDDLEGPEPAPLTGEPADPISVSLYDDEPQFVSSTPGYKEAEYQCKECGEVIDGFQFWCVQCLGSALCGACDARGAHRDHCVLRVPAHRPHRQTQAVLAAIRHQLENEHLFARRETCDGRVKLEVKEELVEPEVPVLYSEPTGSDPLVGHDPLAGASPLPGPDPECGSDIQDSQGESQDDSSDAEEIGEHQPAKRPPLSLVQTYRVHVERKLAATGQDITRTAVMAKTDPRPVTVDQIPSIQLDTEEVEYTDIEILEDLDDDFEIPVNQIDSKGIATRGVDSRCETDETEETHGRGPLLRGPQESMLRYVSDKAVVRLQPLKTVQLKKWITYSKKKRLK